MLWCPRGAFSYARSAFMETAHARRPRIPRETRLVIITALLALVALWGLARVRFPRVPGDAGTPQVLTPLAARPAFELLAARVSAAMSAAVPRLVAFTPTPAGVSAAAPPARTIGWRLRDDLVGFPWPETGQPILPEGSQTIASAPVLGLGVARVSQDSLPTTPLAWPDLLDAGPRYVLVTATLDTGATLRPIWLGGLDPRESALWSATIFGVPSGTDLQPGHLVFSVDGGWLGLAVDSGTGVAIVPAGVVANAVEGLLARSAEPAGDPGIDVQSLTPATARATGAALGVLVAWTDQNGPAASRLLPGDVIEAVDGQPIETFDQWQRARARLVAGTAATFTIRRREATTSVTVIPTATPADAPGAPSARGTRALGLTMRFIPASGSEITAVDRSSMAADAGLEPGDIITWIGTTPAPSPAQVRRAVPQATTGRPVLVGFQRGTRHGVTAFER